jgi:hypothetical protein
MCPWAVVSNSVKSVCHTRLRRLGGSQNVARRSQLSPLGLVTRRLEQATAPEGPLDAGGGQPDPSALTMGVDLAVTPC